MCYELLKQKLSSRCYLPEQHNAVFKFEICFKIGLLVADILRFKNRLFRKILFPPSWLRK